MTVLPDLDNTNVGKLILVIHHFYSLLSIKLTLVFKGHMSLNNKIPHFVLWLGAAISIAEISVGGLLAPLGLEKGIFVIIIGHLIGAILMYFASMIGGISKLPSMQSSRISFGKLGSWGFSIMNILQLIGWTSVMIIAGATALNGITKELLNFEMFPLFAILIGLLIIFYVKMKYQVFIKINAIVVFSLFILCLVLAFVIFKDTNALQYESTQTMSISLGIELSVIMCLSWLPLIADYTCKSDNPKVTSLLSVGAYFVGSSFMYILGLGIVLYTNSPDISTLLLHSGLGLVALFIVLMSTVTTTYLDVYSAGESFLNITKKFSKESIIIVVTTIGTALAILIPMNQYQNFLIMIGSVFAPMIAILITDFFILKKREIRETLDLIILPVFIIGVILYNQMISIETFIGSSVPVIIIIGILTLIVRKIESKIKAK